MSNGQHTLIIKSDGTLWGWGRDEYGQVGNGTTVAIGSPTYGVTSPIQIGTDNKWKKVKLGSLHSLALKSDGTLWSWGYNGNGQLGVGDTSIRTSPTQIGTDSWKDIACGGTHSVGIKSDGTLWAWGANSYGQLGDASTANRTTPVQIGTGNNWKVVAGGTSHTVAIKEDGTLWAWGYNSSGQLGDGTSNNSLTPKQIGTDTDWKYVSCGTYFTLAIKRDNTLWGWGDNQYNQITSETKNNIASPKKIGDNFKHVSCGDSFIVALKIDGTLWGWGYNSYGSLGIGTTTQQSSPKQIGTDNDWKSVSCGSRHTVAIKTNGSLWTWGENNYGQVGNGAPPNNVLSPIQIGTDTNWSILFEVNNQSPNINIVSKNYPTIQWSISDEDTEDTVVESSIIINGVTKQTFSNPTGTISYQISDQDINVGNNTIQITAKDNNNNITMTTITAIRNITPIPILKNDIRFNVKDTDEVVAWVERDELSGFTINAQLNGQNMTKSSVSGEDQFIGTLPNVQPAEIKLTMTRSNVNDNVKINKILGGTS